MVNADLEEYKARTEKEIRRLIRYGQKWKEQAKSQQEENEKLKGMLKDVRKENARLEEEMVLLRQDRLRGGNRGHHNHANTVAPHETDARPAIRRQASLQQKVNELEALKPSPPSDDRSFEPIHIPKQTTKPSRHQPLPAIGHQKNLVTATALAPESRAIHNKQRTALPTPKDRSSPTTNEKDDYPIKQRDPILPQQVPTSSTMAEERRTAARARLDRRRASRAPNIPVPTGQKEGDQARINVEESALDWMDMA